MVELILFYLVHSLDSRVTFHLLGSINQEATLISTWWNPPEPYADVLSVYATILLALRDHLTRNVIEGEQYIMLFHVYVL